MLLWIVVRRVILVESYMRAMRDMTTMVTDPVPTLHSGVSNTALNRVLEGGGREVR